MRTAPGHASRARGVLLGAFGRFARSREGMGAVEFALIAPVLLLLYVGGAQVAMAVTLNRKVQQAGATVNDLVTQAPSVSAAELDGIFGISAAIIEPYPASSLRMRVSAVSVDASGQATIGCSRAHGGSIQALGRGTPYALPAQFSAVRSRTLLVSETYYDYEPFGGIGLKSILTSAENPDGVLRMGETSYLNPRIGSSVGCADW